MRTIGLIGGMSWESTVVYYQRANELVRDRLGGLNSARIIMDSMNFEEISALQKSDRWDLAAQRLAQSAEGLEKAGAEMILICTNTMHKVMDEVQCAVRVPLVHIGDTVAARVHEAGLTKVGLLGTAFTMEQDFYKDRIAGHGLEVITPEAGDRAFIHRVIFEELACGVISDESRTAYQRIIEGLVARGAQGIILGCTEIELLIKASDSSVPVFPTAAIHIEAAVDLALDPSWDPAAQSPELLSV